MAVGQTLGSKEGGLKQSFTTGLTEVASYDKEGVGTHRYENGKWYKWVQYNDGAANLDVVAGDFVNYLAATGHKNAVVTPDTASADSTTPMGAGVILAPVTADLDFCWIQIKGQATLSIDPTGSAGDSNALVPSATDKAMAIATASDVEHICGHATDDSAKEVYLDCPW